MATSVKKFGKFKPDELKILAEQERQRNQEENENLIRQQLNMIANTIHVKDAAITNVSMDIDARGTVQIAFKRISDPKPESASDESDSNPKRKNHMSKSFLKTPDGTVHSAAKGDDPVAQSAKADLVRSEADQDQLDSAKDSLTRASDEDQVPTPTAVKVKGYGSSYQPVQNQ
jgi:hypothetical protein